ncbi:MAG: YeeE/YedE family protein [Caldimonas sp.]
MTEADFQQTTRLVLAAAFAIGLVFGAIGQRTRFCTMGAITDMALMRDPARMRMWLVAAGTAIVGFNAMATFGLVKAADSIYAAPRLLWLSAIVGGLMFGFGMVLASGCTSKNLMRAGAGNLKSVVVLLVVAFAGFATLKGATAIVRVEWLDSVHMELAGGQDLPNILERITGVGAQALAGALGLGLGGALLLAGLAPRDTRSGELVLGGIGIGACVVAAWWASGVLGFVAENPNTLEPTFVATNSHRMEALSFVSAVSYAADYVLFLSDVSKALTVGIVSAVGVALGAGGYALATRSFHVEGFADAADLGRHLVGGALMGVGGVTALGCTIGQGISGLSTLSIGSMLAVAAIVTGALAALQYQAWRMDRPMVSRPAMAA